ncbi:glycosyltransferase family 9 protein [Oxalicibacterium solurbis]|nr:glycosyltransferase family 9 protein [Oxalicibacterium solurbis]
MMQKTLIVHHRNGIGDLVWHVPYIRAIARDSANGKVTVLARPSCRARDLLAGESCVEEVIEYDRRPRGGGMGRHEGFRGQWQFLRMLRGKKFDRIVIFSGRTRYGFLALLAGIPQRLGFGFAAWQRLFLNKPPYIARFAGQGSWVYPEATDFAVAHGFVESAVVPKLAVPAALAVEVEAELASLPHPRIVLAIGASHPRKNWGGEKFLALARTLVAAGNGVLILGGPAEREAAEAVYACDPILLAAGTTRVMCQPSVLRSAAALQVCDFCVGNDTGMLNVAVAVNVPSLGLFGPTLPLQHDPLLHGISAPDMENISMQMVLDRLASFSIPVAALDMQNDGMPAGLN